MDELEVFKLLLLYKSIKFIAKTVYFIDIIRTSCGIYSTATATYFQYCIYCTLDSRRELAS